MNRNQSQACLSCIDGIKTISIFDGIELAYLSLTGDSFSIHHPKAPNILVINYCKAGRMGWKMKNDRYVYLGTSDFSVNTMDLCANSDIVLPNGSYEGIAIYINLQEISINPPDLLLNSGIEGTELCNRLCKNNSLVSIAGNEQTDAIFRYFFDQPNSIQSSYQKIKVLELLLYLFQNEDFSNQCATKYRADQIESIRQIHNHLLDNLDKRITIEELSKQYLMNPTTMKALFKSVYGTSIAAHMKEHRMRKAARMLSDPNASIAEIAFAVGYDSQSKFTAAFKAFFNMLPKEYRKTL